MRGAQGSGFFFAERFALAVFLFICAAAPASAQADSSSLFWGNTDGSSPAQIEIVDGGTYTVPIGVSAPIYFATTTPGGFVSVLYKVGDGGALEQIATPTLTPGDTEFSWPDAGEYELHISVLPVPIFIYHDQLHRLLADLFLPRAYAQFAPTPVETLHFTIKAACVTECYDNVMFLPGIESSRLYGTNDDGSEKRLWEPGSSDDAEQLAFNSDGTSKRSDIYTKDVIDNAYIPVLGNVYQSFIAQMKSLKDSGKINDWQPIPYDWRYTPEQLLASGAQNGNDIFYNVSTSSPYIIQELRQLAATSKTGKVTLIAHSNGGLVAKAMMQELGDTETAALIDKVIFVAVPQVGTPKAIAGLLHGYGEALPFSALPKALSPAAAREVGDTMPGLYYLLPSENYFTYVDDPVTTFSGVANWAVRYGNPIHSVDRMVAFLTDATRLQPPSTDLYDPTTLDATYVAQAETAHRVLDSWVPPSGVKVIQIAGWGTPTTVSGIDYIATSSNDVSGIGVVPNFTIDGDGTVVVPSALWISASDEVKNYWINLDAYSKAHYILTVNDNFPFDHGDILEVTDILNFLEDQITGSLPSASSYPYLSASAPASTDHRLRFALHSPLTLDIYDSNGNHTGVSTTTGDVEENIPGTYYTTFAGVQYIFSDIGVPVHIVMNGYANGTFTFDVDEVDGNNNVVASTSFQSVPTTDHTIVTMDVSGSIAGATPLLVDEDGDGTPDITLPSGGTVVYRPSTPSTPQPSAPASPSSGGGNGAPAGTFSSPSLAPLIFVPATTTAATSSVQLVSNATSSVQSTSTMPVASVASTAVETTYVAPVIHAHVVQKPKVKPSNATLLAGVGTAVFSRSPINTNPTHQINLLKFFQGLYTLIKSVFYKP